jgi:hypothetical protein
MILFITLISLAYIISNQILPVEQYKSHLSNYFDARVISQRKWFKVVRLYVSHLFNCNACICFWLVLIVMGSWQLALIGYVISAILARHLNSISI